MKFIDDLLARLTTAIQSGRFVELETEGIEIKPVPTQGAEWNELNKSVNAFLNTSGGILILGIREEGKGDQRHYVFSGWKEYAEPNVKQIPRSFTNRQGVVEDLQDCFPPVVLRDFLDGRVAIVFVEELAADRKYVFYKGTAYKRSLTGDHKISQAEVDSQEEFKEEAIHARELLPVPGMGPEDLDLDKLNEYIIHLNQPTRIETIKPDLASARPFLERKAFVREGVVTTLGALVCGKYPGDRLGFRAQVHGYVDVPHEVARDKQDLVNNILPLLEGSLAFVLRNIQIGVSVERGGSNVLQYPEQVLRETINNALAHRDYSIDKQVTISIKPGAHVAIQNPGSFRRHLLIEALGDPIPIRRIIPEAKPRNPKLADVLRVYRKWEGRGIGMATLVNLCLDNQIDLPYYRFYQDEVRLHLCAGRLVDDRMERLFQSFSGFLEGRLQGRPVSDEQRRVLAYLIKSEWANLEHRYTILLTPDNNHFSAINGLVEAGLIQKHSSSQSFYDVYVADRVLLTRGYLTELRTLFGAAFDALAPLRKDVLGVVYRYNTFSKIKFVNAKQVSFALWFEGHGAGGDIKQFESFDRSIRRSFNALEKAGFVEKKTSPRGYALRTDFLKLHPLIPAN